MKKRIILLVFFAGLFPKIGWTQQLPTPTPTGADQVVDAAGRLVQTYLQVSLDVVHQRLYGPSYQGSSPNPVQLLLLNFAVQTNNKKLIDQIIKNVKNGVSRRTIKPADEATLVASTDTHPGPTTLAPKASFLSHLSLQYGVQLIGKGGKYADGFGTSTTKMTYLEPMATVLYNYELPDNKGQIFGGLGPYLAYGLWGTAAYKDPTTNQSSGAFDSKNGGYKRFDAGLIFTAGYQLPQGLRLSIAYELGLVDIESGGGADGTQNRVWSLNVGYSLQKLTDKFRKK